MDTMTKWRDEISKFSKDELIDELKRPLGIWIEDVKRETLLRIYENLTKHNNKIIQSSKCHHHWEQIIVDNKFEDRCTKCLQLKGD